jgi:hypothetical protein
MTRGLADGNPSASLFLRVFGYLPSNTDCAPQSLNHADGRRLVLVMQATPHRSDEHRKALADPMAG